MLNKRAQILFDTELWEKLNQLAAAKRTSAAQIVREAVSEKYQAEQDLEKRRLAVENTLKYRVVVKGRLDYKALINEGRKY